MATQAVLPPCKDAWSELKGFGGVMLSGEHVL